MKNLEEIILEAKMQIRSRIVNCNCSYRGLNKKVDSFVSFTPNGFSFVENFNLAEVPVSGPIIVNIRFNALTRIDIDGNVKAQSYLGGNYGPLIISFDKSEYRLDQSTATLSDLRD